jgi:hypothetical protein
LFLKKTLEKSEGAINNGQPRDTCNIGHKTQNEDKKKPQNIFDQRSLQVMLKVINRKYLISIAYR